MHARAGGVSTPPPHRSGFWGGLGRGRHRGFPAAGPKAESWGGCAAPPPPATDLCCPTLRAAQSRAMREHTLCTSNPAPPPLRAPPALGSGTERSTAPLGLHRCCSAGTSGLLPAPCRGCTVTELLLLRGLSMQLHSALPQFPPGLKGDPRDGCRRGCVGGDVHGCMHGAAPMGMHA